jgi:hypothetical protein
MEKKKGDTRTFYYGEVFLESEFQFLEGALEVQTQIRRKLTLKNSNMQITF